MTSHTGLVWPPGYIRYSRIYTAVPVMAVMNQMTEVTLPHLRCLAYLALKPSVSVVMPNTAATVARTM
ncbi:hypothetical protein D3C79_980930 [compost metagenome]